MYPSVEDGVAFVTLVQVVGSDDTRGTVALGHKHANSQHELPVAFVLQYTTCTEDSATSLAALISVSQWAVHRIWCYTVTASSLEVVLPDDAYKVAVVNEDAHIHLRAMLVDIEPYRVKWVHATNPWAIGGWLVTLST